MRLWDAQTGAEVLRLEGLSENVPAAGFSPDGRRVVLAVDDRTARIWDLASNQQLVALSGHLEPMQFAAFAPDGIRPGPGIGAAPISATQAHSRATARARRKPHARLLALEGGMPEVAATYYAVLKH